MSEFIREDWTKFRSLGELPRAAGVPVGDLKKLVAKELADNALDVSGACRAGLDDTGAFWVEDDGPGIPGTPEQIAQLFSIARPLTSSKQLRLPTRGALGNGLRVVAGYALATRGTLTVYSSGKVLELAPQDDGSTRIVNHRDCDRNGTRIEMRLGIGQRFSSPDLVWAHRAQLLAGAPCYSGDSSPHWFDEDAFWELCQAFDGYARDLIAKFDGCKNPKAGLIAAPWKGRLSASLSRLEAGRLLASARHATKPCKPSRLGFIGRDHPGLPGGYARETGEFSPESAGGTLRAKLPFVVEVWTSVGSKDSVIVNVNRTPISASVEFERLKKKAELGVWGCGLSHAFAVGHKPVKLILNIQTPYMPITSDGKAPDLLPMSRSILRAVGKAANAAKRIHLQSSPVSKRRPETEIVRDVLDVAIAMASGDGASRFSLRQLFYQVRPFIIEELGKEPTYENFAKIITAIESERGEDIEGIYRDTRGTIYHPHMHEELALGTLTVEGYNRPAWTFNKILYLEKEGFFQLLKDLKWPERHDCALLTSKGQPTRAARDILDLMGDSCEDLTFFCIHDADAAGTIIYQSLQDETKARPARRVRIENLGLEPEEALAMGLRPEKLDALKDGRSVAKYVSPEWGQWLQTARVELNAMTSPQFVQWLDNKMAQHDGAKLIPPTEVLSERLSDAARNAVTDILTERILSDADLIGRVSKTLDDNREKLGAAAETIDKDTRTALQGEPAKWWAQHVEDVAREVISKVL